MLYCMYLYTVKLNIDRFVSLVVNRIRSSLPSLDRSRSPCVVYGLVAKQTRQRRARAATRDPTHGSSTTHRDVLTARFSKL